MRIRFEFKINDGKTEAPPLEADVRNLDDLLGHIEEQVTNDYGELFGPGFTLHVERLS